MGVEGWTEEMKGRRFQRLRSEKKRARQCRLRQGLQRYVTCEKQCAKPYPEHSCGLTHVESFGVIALVYQQEHCLDGDFLHGAVNGWVTGDFVRMIMISCQTKMTNRDHCHLMAAKRGLYGGEDRPALRLS